MLLAGKGAAGLPKPGALDLLPFGFEACRPALQMIIGYCVQQRLIPRRFRGRGAVRRHHAGARPLKPARRPAKAGCGRARCSDNAVDFTLGQLVIRYWALGRMAAIKGQLGKVGRTPWR